MKRLMVETEEGPFDSMLGEKVQLWCGVYIYAGTLAGVNDEFVELKDASVVYETGALDAKAFKDAQKIPGVWRVMKHAIEAWGVGK